MTPAWIPVDPALRLAALAAVGIALVSLLLLLNVLAISAWASRQRRLRDAFNREWRPQLALASVDDQGFPRLAPPRGRRRLWWLMLWNRLQRQLRGEASARLRRLLLLFGLQGYAVQLLHRPGVRRRLVALETLRHLADRAHWSSVEPLCHHRNTFVAMAAAHALVEMDPPRATRQLVPLALRRDDWGPQRLVALFRHAGREVFTPVLLDALRGATERQLGRLVPLLAHADPAAVAPWARGCVASDPEARNRHAALHALGELGDPRDHALFVAALGDEDAGVRLAAVGALRRQAATADVDALLPMLADRSWWVRREAADALVALPRIDADRLHALLPQVQDRYGREALQRAIDERAARGRVR